jgi:hydroxymethylpyrimidine pyrophosphatase-like HAD family hydrolase
VITRLTANLFKGFFGLWLLLYPCLSFGHGNTNERLGVVFDLDWTLLNSTTEAMVQADPAGTFSFEGKWYRIAYGTAQAIKKLHDQGIDISIFSGGSSERNEFAAKIIEKQIQDLGVSDFKFNQILDLHDLLVVSQDPNARFADRYKKELSRYFDVKRTLIVDDMTGFSVSGQEKNLVWLGKTYNDRPRFELQDIEAAESKSYSAPDYNEWRRDRNKIITAVSDILKAEALMREKSISLPDAFYMVDPYKTKFPMCGNLF